MGKSIRSKIKKRFRTAKRQRVDQVLVKPSLTKKNQSLLDIANGTVKAEKKPINWFLYPDTPDAEVPRLTLKTPVDFRCENLPMAGYAFRGNRRKYNAEEVADRAIKAKQHPDIKIIAGKGFEPSAAACANPKPQENLEPQAKS
eukprot:GEMP01077686.1.p1 GENE.GEMP01077686.1~~GEMP01077686.1.p1  ORF type:complete len:144 (+),score=27.71 GEMP01077686.1:278-709(+)